jgi:hypothetical protein
MIWASVFYVICFNEATIIVESDKSREVSHLINTLKTISPPKTGQIVEDTTAGRVAFTFHAQERLAQRHEEVKMGTPKNTYKLLKQLLCRPLLKKIQIAHRVSRHKQMKYKDAETEIWKSEDNPFYFTIAKNSNGSRTVVTVFTRSEKYENDMSQVVAWKQNLFAVAK